MITAQYLLGLFYILLVNILWTSVGVLVQMIFKHNDFNSPFLITYWSSAMFMLYLTLYLPLLCKQGYVCIRKLGYGQLNGEESEITGNCISTYSPSGYPGVLVVEAEIEMDTPSMQEVSICQLTEQKSVSRCRGRSPSTAGEADGNTCCLCCVIEQSNNKLPLSETVKIALKLSFFWFGTNYITKVSLLYTSLGSSSVL